ncbi:MAG TPA: sodium:solute symporter family protein [Lacipirellulaceae bacterium]|nr:sodium:solute symporter family protein [Lacipirellulaceae bacterium]
MRLQAFDVCILVAYFAATIVIGLWSSRRGNKDLDSYVLGDKSLPWYVLGISDASGMFDISGTMLMVYWLFVYGAKSLWLPFAWPVFNQIFLMMFLSGWLRRSSVLTGAEWIQFRFGRGTGANLAHLSVVAFALLNVIAMLAYAFRGIGEFAEEMLPWNLYELGAGAFPAIFAGGPDGLLSNENLYAMAILLFTSLYAIKGGMVSVVITEVMQFFLLSATSIIIGVIAMAKVSPEMIERIVPAGWLDPFFGKTVGLDWTGILPHGNALIRSDGNELFAVVFGLMFFKGVLASLAGPAPNYDMQRILATRSPREACLMNGMVNVVLYLPRYMMITGITVLALAFCMPEIQPLSKQKEYEGLLPIVLGGQIPTGVVGLMLAGLLAAFMSNFAATINAAPAYVVNDVYKRFINPDCPPKQAVRLSRLSAVAILIIGVAFGMITDSVFEIMRWIVGALYSGYVVANVLQWYWWRFNGYGYFWGMASGMVTAMALPAIARTEPLAGWLASQFGSINDLYFIPPILAISTIGCIAGTLLAPPEDEETLLEFYRTTRPWGFWGPIRAKASGLVPPVSPNRNFPRDAFNVAVGIVWQLCLTALPVYFVLKQWSWVGGLAALLAATSLILKFTWYDHLEKTAPATMTL